MTVATVGVSAHTEAVRRCVEEVRYREVRHHLDDSALARMTLRDLPNGPAKAALMNCRFVIGLSMCPNSRVLVDDSGRPLVTVPGL